VCYAVCDEGWELPVIDITHPEFALELSPEEIAAISSASLRGLKAAMRLPRFVRRFLGRNAVLLRDADATFVGGMTTYLQKIGPENLGRGYASGMDREVARAIGPTCMRLRMRDIARSLAEGVIPVLAKRSGPLHLINIAGGATADSFNALIVLRKTQARLLSGRKIAIHALDLEGGAVGFAARAIAALTAQTAPLEGLDVSFDYLKYDWSVVGPLKNLLAKIYTDDAVIAGSTEGGLFEYGTDEEITKNLDTLRDWTPPDFVMVGSVMRDAETVDPNIRLMTRRSRLKVRLLGMEAFGALVTRAGWKLDDCRESSTVYQVVRVSRA
jgi:hypothetical protein